MVDNDKETFKWHPLYDSGKNLNSNVKVTQLGEGSEHRQPIGINWRSWQWDLVYQGAYAQMREIESFLYRHGDLYSFNWVSPDGEEVIVKCISFKKTRIKAAPSISVTFKQVFE